MGDGLERGGNDLAREFEDLVEFGHDRRSGLVLIGIGLCNASDA